MTSQAVTVQGLYEGTVQVLDKSTASQSKGIRSALLQVIVKLTGKRTAAGIFGVDSILSEPKRYLQQYEIRSQKNPEDQITEYLLWAKFDANVLESAMREYSIPIWSQERPSTLVWLVYKDSQGQRFSEMSKGAFFYDTLMTQANARGISLLVPRLDSGDLAIVNVKDIVTNAMSPIKEASNRYQSNNILTAVVNSLGSGLWEVNWVAMINDQRTRWSTSGSSAGEAIGEGIDTLADKLAALYSQDVGYANESSFDITISGINDFTDYTRTLRYLESLNFISQVDVKKAVDTTITYRLVAHGDIATLEQATSLSRILKPIGDGSSFQYIQ